MIRRVVALVFVLVVLASASFMMVCFIPGYAVARRRGQSATPAQLESSAINSASTSRSRSVRAVRINLAHSDRGASFVTHEPVANVITNGAIIVPARRGFAGVRPHCEHPSGHVTGALTRDGRRNRFEITLTAANIVVGALPEYLMESNPQAFAALYSGASFSR